MKTISLNGAWQMRADGESEWIQAAVPGSVYADLLRAGKMEDPYWRDNEMESLKLMENDFLYRRDFELTSDFLDADALLLRCEGLDTLCEIRLNGKFVAKSDNMHRIWEFDAEPFLRDGKNEIEIRFLSPTKFIKKAYADSRADGASECMKGFPHLRKAHCMFGWDWGPRLPDAGVWRDISLVAVDAARIQSVYIAQEHAPGRVSLSFRPEIQSFTEGAEIIIRVTGPDGSTYEAENNALTIENPQLWWPNGYGAQPLYAVAATLSRGGVELDRWERKIGLRSITVRREPDQWGESFCHEVNGVAIFAMGADYIPEDCILPRMNSERTRQLLTDCVAANFNVVRVWGGGHYPSDYFYDLCDELGLLVWQDLMFACAVYDLTPQFEASIRAELSDNIRRIRHHACLGLWCGNNEMEMFVNQGEWVSSPRQKADYIKMYEYIFPNLLRELDPASFYWPSSPSCGGSFDDPNSPCRGDVHYWDVWHQNKPFSEYRKFYFRYVSEFGFQSFPCLKTVDSFAPPEDQNIFSHTMEKHQRNNAANGKIMGYLAQTFPYPYSLDALIYASQLLQAEAIRYGVEHWRRHRGRCMGAIYWQLNDCWPVASWSSIDYHGRWKALHYYSKRFFAPVLLSCEEHSAFTDEPNVNAEIMPEHKSVRFSVANETMREFCGIVRWSLRHVNGDILRSGEIPVAAQRLSALWLDEIDLTGACMYDNYVWYELLDDRGAVISQASVLFCPPKYFHFPDPRLTCERIGDTIIVTSGAFAKSVEIEFANGDAVFSDNFFDMTESRREIKILRGDGEYPRLRSAFDLK